MSLVTAQMMVVSESIARKIREDPLLFPKTRRERRIYNRYIEGRLTEDEARRMLSVKTREA